MATSPLVVRNASLFSNLELPVRAKPAKDTTAPDICFKVFVVFTIVLAAVIVVAGILALMASHGALPDNMSSISRLSLIGEVNSYMMLIGGMVLFILGILAWSCQLKKDNQRLRSVL